MWAFRTRNRVESGARPAVANWWISNREGSVSGGAIQIHPLIRLACDSWQRRDQQLSIRRGSVRSSVLVWNAAARSRIGATAGGYREATKFCQPSCQRKAAKNAGGLSGEGQAVLCVQTAKKRPFSLTQNQPPKTGKGRRMTYAITWAEWVGQSEPRFWTFLHSLYARAQG